MKRMNQSKFTLCHTHSTKNFSKCWMTTSQKCSKSFCKTTLISFSSKSSRLCSLIQRGLSLIMKPSFSQTGIIDRIQSSRSRLRFSWLLEYLNLLLVDGICTMRHAHRTKICFWTYRKDINSWLRSFINRLELLFRLRLQDTLQLTPDCCQNQVLKPSFS